MGYKYDNNLPVGELVISTHSDESRSCFLDFHEIKKNCLLLANNAIGLYEKTKKSFKKIILTKSTYGMDEELVVDQFCMQQKRELRIFSYISAGSTDTYILQPTLGVHNLDYWKKNIQKNYNKFIRINKKKYISHGEDFFKYMRYGQGNRSSGMPFFTDFFDNKIKIVPSINKNKKKLLYSQARIGSFFALGEDFRKKNNSEVNHYELLKKILEDKSINKLFDVSVRWHPNLSSAGKEEREVINKIIDCTSINKTHYRAENKINSYKLIENSDIVISFGSTIGVEATFYGKPSILLGVAYYEDTGCVYNPKSYEEFIKLLNSNLAPLPKINAIKYGANEYYKGIKYLHINRNKNHEWFSDGKNVLYHSKLRTCKKLIRIFLNKIGILGYIKKKYSLFLYLIGKRKTKDMTPIKWLNSDI